MIFDLDEIQKMWEKDSKIDIDNLHTESLNIPVLHAKYFDLYNGWLSNTESFVHQYKLVQCDGSVEREECINDDYNEEYNDYDEGDEF